jgi:hypothetical protein
MVVGKEMLRKYHFPHTKSPHIDEENLGSLKFVSSIKCACQRHENLRDEYKEVLLAEGYEPAYSFLQDGLKKIYREDQQNEDFIGIFSD